MAQSTTKLLFGRPYTQRASFGLGMLMLIAGGALLFWKSSTEVVSLAVASGFLVAFGGVLLIAGPVGDRLNNQFLSKHWRLATGIGSILAGIACLLFPVIEPSVFLIVVGLTTGISLVGQGIITVRGHT